MLFALQHGPQFKMNPQMLTWCTHHNVHALALAEAMRLEKGPSDLQKQDEIL
jgi:hypothetical protein